MSGFSSSYAMYIPLFLIVYTFRSIDMVRQKRFLKEQVCHGTNTTLRLVERCPENYTMFQESSKKKMCEQYPKCLGKPLVYHCVRTKDNLVEVCAPSDPIVGSCCSVFDMGIGRVVEDYTSPSAECPFVYQSNDFLNCSTCVKPKKKTYSTELNFNGTTTFSISAGCKPEDCSENASHIRLNIIVLSAVAVVTVCVIAILYRYRLHIKGILKKTKENRKGSGKCSSYADNNHKGVHMEPFIVNEVSNTDPT